MSGGQVAGRESAEHHLGNPLDAAVDFLLRPKEVGSQRPSSPRNSHRKPYKVLLLALRTNRTLGKTRRRPSPHEFRLLLSHGWRGKAPYRSCEYRELVLAFDYCGFVPLIEGIEIRHRDIDLGV